jgi:peptidoglycan/LPS O-acetylase OafA/YrhL
MSDLLDAPASRKRAAGGESDSAYARFRASRYLSGLDGLRAISIVAVIAFHAHLLPFGHYGVQLFFAISGVLITTLLLRERDAAGEISLRNFYVRRTLRIFPLYYAVLSVYVLTVAVFERGSPAGREFWQNLPYFATYTSNWFVPQYAGQRIIFYFAWSLATEEQFYLFWPAVVRSSRSWRRPVLVMLALLLAGEAAGLAVHSGVVPAGNVLVRILDSIAAPICLGSIAAFALHSRHGFGVIDRVLRLPGAPLACLVAAIASAAVPGTPLLAVSAAFTAAVLACVLRPPAPVRAFLELRWVRYVGSISYGMYLMHMLSMNLVHRLLRSAPDAVVFGLGLAVTVVVAGLSSRYFEARFLALKDRFTVPAARPAAAPAPAPRPVPVAAEEDRDVPVHA